VAAKRFSSIAESGTEKGSRTTRPLDLGVADAQVLALAVDVSRLRVRRALANEFGDIIHHTYTIDFVFVATQVDFHVLG